MNKALKYHRELIISLLCIRKCNPFRSIEIVTKCITEINDRVTTVDYAVYVRFWLFALLLCMNRSTIQYRDHTLLLILSGLFIFYLKYGFPISAFLLFTTKTILRGWTLNGFVT
jgi:hypothetical protein